MGNSYPPMVYLGDGKRRNALVWAKSVPISTFKVDPPDPDRSIFQVLAMDNSIAPMVYLGDEKRRIALVWAKTARISA